MTALVRGIPTPLLWFCLFVSGAGLCADLLFIDFVPFLDEALLTWSTGSLYRELKRRNEAKVAQAAAATQPQLPTVQPPATATQAP